MYNFGSNYEAEKASDIVFKFCLYYCHYCCCCCWWYYYYYYYFFYFYLFIYFFFSLTYMHGIDKYILGQTCFWGM